MLTGLGIWVLLSLAFAFGFIVRGLFALGDVRELDARRDREAAEIARLNRMVR